MDLSLDNFEMIKVVINYLLKVGFFFCSFIPYICMQICMQSLDNVKIIFLVVVYT